MVPSFLLPLSKHIASFRAFESITLRAICAALTAFRPGCPARWRTRLVNARSSHARAC